MLPGSSVSDVFINVVNVWSHSGYHCSQTSRLGKVGDDLPPLHTSIVVLINQQGLNYYKDLQGGGREKDDVMPYVPVW